MSIMEREASSSLEGHYFKVIMIMIRHDTFLSFADTHDNRGVEPHAALRNIVTSPGSCQNSRALT